MVEHVKVVLKECLFHAGQVCNRHPVHLHGIVVGLYRRQGAITQVKVVRMGNGAPTLTAVWMVKHRDLLQGRAQGRFGQGAMGFFCQLAQTRLP